MKLGDKKFQIVDGQQRLTAIWQYKNGDFALEGRISGKHLDNLSTPCAKQLRRFWSLNYSVALRLSNEKSSGEI